MPQAKIKFHPNGGNINTATAYNALNDLDKCSTLMNWFNTDNPYNVGTLFTRVGYSGKNWTLRHPTDSNSVLTIE
jgi:hypothetical protein